MPFETSDTLPPKVGLIVLQADETVERDMRSLLPEELDLLVSRVPSGAHVTPESLAAMEASLEHAASLFPASAHFRTIGYACTSGTAQIGAERIARLVSSGASTEQVTEPVSALVAACHHLGIGRLGLLSPYIQSVSARLCDTLEQADINVTAFASFNESAEERVARITPDSVISAACVLAEQAELDGLFLSCTNLRTLDVIEAIEARTGLPVLSSNTVLAWHMLRQASLGPPPQLNSRLWSQS